MPVVETEALETLRTLLGGDYDQIRPLNEDGGLSRLYRARKTGLDVDVVIKRMKIKPGSSIDAAWEAKVMTNLRHQYLPRVFDFKTDGQGYCYTIMELIPGRTLRQYVARTGALDQKRTLLWMKQLCQAAAYMHGCNPPIIHSDIKPENIMVTPEGNLCLIDFNASLELRDDGVEAVAATMCYAAPEQYNIPLKRFSSPSTMTPQRRAVYEMAKAAQGIGKVTARTDLYAIGAVAYFMLTGYDPPCWNDEPVPLTRYEIVLGDSLRQVIERCMERQPSKRFSSASELGRALDNLAYTDGRYRAWRRTCQITALAVGAGMILSAFCAVQGWMGIQRQTGEEYNSLIAQAQQMDSEMDYAGEEELLFQAVRLERKRPEAYANLGALLYRQGEYQQAVELLDGLEFEETGTLDSEAALSAQGQIQYVLASCYYQLEDYHHAKDCYQLAAYLCPNEAAYLRDLAVCCAKLGDSAQAQQAVEQMKQLSVQPGDVELASGEIAYAAGDYEQALDLLSQAMRLSNDHVAISRASLQAAQCCQQLGSDWLEQEVELLETAANRLNTTENGVQLQALSDALFRLAPVQPEESQNCYERALACLNELMARGQPSFAVRQNAALALEYLDRFQEAEELLRQLQSDYPKDYRPPMRLALLYADQYGASLEDVPEFAELYKQANELYDPSGVPDSDMNRLQELARPYVGG